MHHVLGGHEAVAGVGIERVGRGLLALQQRDHGGGTRLAVLVGHVARLGHGRCDLDRITQHVDVFLRLGLEGEEVHLAPARVRRGQAGLHRDVAGAHVGQHVGHGGLEVVVELELQGVGGGVHVHNLVFGAVVDHAVVVFLPGLHEQALLGLDVVVGVEDHDLAPGLGLLEVVGHHAGAFVGAGRAAVGRQRDRQRVHAAVGHGVALFAQRHGLGAGLPGVQHFVLCAGLGHAGQAVPHEVDAGREDQAVVGQFAAARELDHAFVGVDAGDPIAHDLHAMALGEVVVGRGDVGERLAALDHQVGDGAGDEGCIGLDQGDLDAVVGEEAHVFGGGGAAVAPTDHHHLGAAAARGGATAHEAQTGDGGARAERLYKLTTLHGRSPYFFWAAK
ncbi:hypothetical protein D9M68_633970 [compost metagenome]